MENFIQVLRIIIEKPGMFCVDNIEDLYFFTLGYSIASSNKGDPGIHTFLDKFSDFITAKYEQPTRVEWNKYIRFVSGGDTHSLELFKNNFIEYCNENNIVWPAVI